MQSKPNGEQKEADQNIRVRYSILGDGVHALIAEKDHIKLKRFLQLLPKEQSYILNYKSDVTGLLPLQAAIIGADVPTVQVLLDAGADPTFFTTDNLFGIAFAYTCIAQSLQEDDYKKVVAYLDIVSILRGKITDCLIATIRQGNAENAQKCLIVGADPYQKIMVDGVQKTILDLGLKSSVANIFQEWLRGGFFQEDQKLPPGNFDLYSFAVQARKEYGEFLKWIESQGIAKKNALVSILQAGLVFPLEVGKIIESIIADKSFDWEHALKAVDQNGCGPLTYALLYPKDRAKGLVETFLQKGADIFQDNALGKVSPAEIVLGLGKQEICLQFQDYIKKVSKTKEGKEKVVSGLDKEFGVHTLVAYADVALMRYALDKGYKFDEANQFGRTPLMRAVAVGRQEIARFLIDKGARLDIEDVDGEDILSKAIKGASFFQKQGEIEQAAPYNRMVEYIEEKIKLKGGKQRVAEQKSIFPDEHKAPQKKLIQAKFLAIVKASKKSFDEMVRECLSIEGIESCIDALAFVFELSEKVKPGEIPYDTLLEQAEGRDDFDRQKFVKSTELISLCAAMGKPDLIEKFLAWGANPFEIEDNQFYILGEIIGMLNEIDSQMALNAISHYCVDFLKKHSLVDFLKKYSLKEHQVVGASLRLQSNEFLQAVIASKAKEGDRAVSILLNKQERITGRTPLMFVAEAGRMDMVKTLLEAGANITIRNKQGKDAYDLVTKRLDQGILHYQSRKNLLEVKYALVKCRELLSQAIMLAKPSSANRKSKKKKELFDSVMPAAQTKEEADKNMGELLEQEEKKCRKNNGKKKRARRRQALKREQEAFKQEAKERVARVKKVSELSQKEQKDRVEESEKQRKHAAQEEKESRSENIKQADQMFKAEQQRRIAECELIAQEERDERRARMMQAKALQKCAREEKLAALPKPLQLKLQRLAQERKIRKTQQVIHEAGKSLLLCVKNGDYEVSLDYARKLGRFTFEDVSLDDRIWCIRYLKEAWQTTTEDNLERKLSDIWKAFTKDNFAHILLEEIESNNILMVKWLLKSGIHPFMWGMAYKHAKQRGKAGSCEAVTEMAACNYHWKEELLKYKDAQELYSNIVPKGRKREVVPGVKGREKYEITLGEKAWTYKFPRKVRFAEPEVTSVRELAYAKLAHG